MEWSASKLEADLLRDLLERVDAIVEIADRLEAAQSLSRLEARLFRMERAARRSELLLLNAQTQQLELQLKSLLGLVPDAPLALIPQVAGEIPEAVDDVFEAIEQRNPTVAVHRAAYAVAEENLHREVRKQYPDLQIGPAYEWDEGQNKIGLGAGLPLPLLNANKHGIAVARAERDAVRAEYESAVESLVSAYWQARSQFVATTAAREAIEQELLPLAEAQINDARQMAELGEFDVLLTLESVVRAHDTNVQLIKARLAEAMAASVLRALCVQEPQVTELETNS
jgi:outer membrane protein TolC